MQKISDYKATLGEGAVWNHKTNQLYWVDIEAQRLLILDPVRMTNRIIQFDQEIGTVVPTEDGQVLVALEDGIYKLQLDNEQLTRVAANETVKDTRFNDGKCDPAGRFWVGTMERTHKRPVAALYRLDGNYRLQTMVTGVIISNGIIWSPAGDKMYYIDTRTQKVVAYKYNLESGEICESEDCILVDPELGRPDGCTIDSEGMLWIALWAGSAITRWNPVTGRLLAKIPVPAKNISSVAFGGKDLDTLYITTARSGMTAAEAVAFPEAGSLFAFKPGVRGIPAGIFSAQTKK